MRAESWTNVWVHETCLEDSLTLCSFSRIGFRGSVSSTAMPSWPDYSIKNSCSPMYQLLNPFRNGLVIPLPKKTCMLLGQIWSYLSTLVIFVVPRDDIYVKLLMSSSPCSLCCTFHNRISSQREEASWSLPVWFVCVLRSMYIIYFLKSAVSVPQNLTCLSLWVMLCMSGNLWFMLYKIVEGHVSLLLLYLGGPENYGPHGSCW